MRPPWAASAPFQSAPERWSEGAWSTEWRSQPPYHVRSKGRGQASTAFLSAVERPPPPLFLVLDVIFITFIIIIVVIIPCSIRVPFLLFLALAPARLALLSRSLCPIGHRVQLGEGLADAQTRISRPVGRVNRNEYDKGAVESRASVPCLGRCCGRVEESFWLRVGCPCFR